MAKIWHKSDEKKSKPTCLFREPGKVRAGTDTKPNMVLELTVR